MIIGKRYTFKTIDFSFTVSNSLVGFVSCVTREPHLSTVHEYVHRVYIGVLGLQFVYMPKCTQSRFSVCIYS